MRLITNNGDYIYIEDNGALLQEVDGRSYLVGNTTLYGITEDGTRCRLTSTISDSSNLYNLEYYEESSSSYNAWYQSSDYIEWTSVPPSLRADDTFNFRNFNIELIGCVILAVFIIFCVFKRR